MNSYEKKSQQLGMNVSKAKRELGKKIIFDLVQRLGENICYRCGKVIESVNELSVDHKKSWLDADPALFWDLDNIAFSHLSCNIKHGNINRKYKRQPVQHGTHNAYASGCRCEECRESQRLYMGRYREQCNV